MNNYISVDFGMQNLKVCYYDGRKNHRVDLEGNPLSGSKSSKNAVYYKDNDNGNLLRYFFGAEEAEQARKYLDFDYVCYIKRELQKEHYSRTFCGGKYRFTALQIITDIFRQIHKKMEEERYDTHAPTILTVPVVFSEMQKEMLRSCAEKAGFCVQEIITEPFAALFSEQFFDECIDDIDGEEYVMILDFGASTLDFCLFQIRHLSDDIDIKTLSSAGLSFGGKDITDLLTKFLMEKYKAVSESLIQSNRLDEESLGPTFFEIAEEVKNKLYEDEDTPEVERSFYGSKVVLKRTNVDKILESTGIWKQIHKIITEMLEATDELDADDTDLISKVIMTGGTSKIQYFRDKIQTLFEEAELIGDPEDLDSIYCAVSSGGVNYAIQDCAVVSNSLPMSFGIDIGNGFESVLKRNSFYHIPGKRKQLSRTKLEKNRWKIKVYQTIETVRERSNVQQEGILFAGFIQLDPTRYKQDGDICMQFQYTADGLVASTAYVNELKHYIDENILLSTEVQYE